jgi:hypothetical protein
MVCPEMMDLYNLIAIWSGTNDDDPFGIRATLLSNKPISGIQAIHF